MREPQDTIVALSSALSGAATSRTASLRRAVIRLSGPDALNFASTVFHASAGSHSRTLGWRRMDGTVAWGGYWLPACLYSMPGPRSYTREDVTELHVPSLPPLVLDLLEDLVRCGARPALPGEFTRRALLKGRISIAQAEAVGALVRAERADEARSWAAHAANGAVHRQGLRKKLEDLLALVELGLDFSQEDIETQARESLLATIRDLARQAHDLAQSSGQSDQQGVRRNYDPRVVLAGPTNAGKSRILNALLGRAAAVVSPVRHTTRDLVEAVCEITPGEAVVLVDTAGFGEEQGASRWLEQALCASREAVRGADILVWVIDRSQPEGSMEIEHLIGQDAGTSAQVLFLLNKADLPEHPTTPHIVHTISARLTKAGQDEDHGLLISAATGIGLEHLRQALSLAARNVRVRLAAARTQGATISRTSLQRAATALAHAEDALLRGLGEDAAVVELRAAVQALSAADGVLLQHDVLTERLLDRIFADFCVGK